MKLILLTEIFLPTKGGTGVWAAEVYRRLGRQDAHILAADVPGAAEFDAVYPNPVHRLKLERTVWLKPESLAMYWRLFSRALRLALTRRPDAVHAMRALPEGLAAWLVSRIVRVPLIVYAHGEELSTWNLGNKFRAMRFVLARADRVIANSEDTRAKLLALGVRPERIRLLYPGVDLDRFRPGLDASAQRAALGLGPDDFLILSVGRLSRRKGFDHTLRAVAQLRGRGLPVHYAIVGIGEDAEYLDGLIRELGVGAWVHRLGAVDADELPRWMNACEVFAMPNRDINGDNEGFGMVFVEAAACGKTAVAGRAGGTGSAVLDNETGLRVDGDSVEAIAAALARLYDDPDWRSRLAARALARARAEFSWEQVADKTRALMDELK